MPAIITAILDGVAIIWIFVVEVFGPSSTEDIILVEFSLWAWVLLGLAITFLSLVRRGRRR